MSRFMKKGWIWLCLIFFFLIGIYYGKFTSQHSYLGITADYYNGHWIVTDVHSGGLAKSTSLSTGDSILKIDNQRSQDNFLLNKWLIVEQSNRILVNHRKRQESISFETEKVLDTSFFFFEVIAFSLLVWAMSSLNRKKITKISSYYSFFLVATAFFLSSLIPSSMGNGLGRLFIVTYITLLPFFVDIFWRISVRDEEVTKLSMFSKVVIVYSFLTILLFFGVQLFNLPLFFVRYLSRGIFYVSFALLLILATFSLLVRERELSLKRVNLVLLTLFSLLPLFIGYVFPLPYELPFSCTIPLLFLPIMAVVNHLIVNRLTVARAQLPLQVVYVLEALVSTLVMMSFSVMMNYMPIWFVAIYCFLYIWFSLPIIKDFMLMAKKLNYHLDGQNIFSAVEMEREDISIAIHDTIIQDVIYHKKQIESADTIDKYEILNTLDDVIFELRELCSNIYPLMIKELGLKNAILELVDKFQKEEPVLIECEIDFNSSAFESRINNFILRSIKELITNSVLHGNAKQIKLSLFETANQVVVQVRDDGKFIERPDDHKSHFGLNVIAEKLSLLGGELQIEKSPTIVRMILPKGDKNVKNSSDR